MKDGHADSQKELEHEIAMLRLRLEGAEEMWRAIAGAEIDGFVVGRDDEDRRVMLLEAAHPHFEEVLHRMQQGAVTVSRSGRILYANQRFATMVGELLPALFSTSLHDHITPADRERLDQLIAGCVPDSSMDVVLKRRDGRLLPVRLSGAAFGEGRTSLLVTDLTHGERQEEAEHTLRALHSGEIDGVVVGAEQIMLLGNAYRPYAAMVDRMQQGAVTVSPGGDMLYASDRFVAMTGRERDKLLGAPLSYCFAPEHRGAVEQICARAAAGESSEAEVELACHDGSPLPVLVTGAPDDSSDAVTLVITDLTEQRRHRDIQEADRRKDEFLAILAHELRNPLAPIRTAIEVIHRAGSLDASSRQAAEIISRQSATLARLLDDLIDINRLNQGKITLQRTRVEMKSIVASAVEAVQPMLQERGHALEVDVADEPVYVDGDPIRLTQILLNLLSNAAKYTHQRGRIRVALQQRAGIEGARAIVRVSDTGIGIAPELLRTIFEPYTQLGASSDSIASGLGLGLTVARRLAELHEGSIAATSAGAGMGSEFTIELPAIAPEVAPVPVTDGDGRAAAAVEPLRILVADDNADSALSLAMLLEMSGHRTRTALDGIEALEAADEFRPDLAFIDIGMPRMDGYATARELRGRPWARDMVLIALTGWGQQEDRRRAKEAGFDEHVVKPLDPEAIERLMSGKALRRGSD